MSNKKILIVSGSGDAANFMRVARHLKLRGYEVVVYQPDSVAIGKCQFSASVDANGVLTILYRGEPFVPEDFAAAWLRRPNYYGQDMDNLRWLMIKDEYRSLTDAILAGVPTQAWFNEPEAMRIAGNKLNQLVVAHEIGFHVAETVITNQWQDVENMKSDELIVKMHRNVTVPSPEGQKILPSTIVERNNLPKSSSPYPGIWQGYIAKKKEWRVIVVGEQVFSAAIYTDKDARDDWRKHQFTPKVEFKAEEFPKEHAAKCVRLVKQYGMNYGALDFVETPEGDMHFLEINPNGQYMWLELDLGLPISEAVASELIRIAEAA